MARGRKPAPVVFSDDVINDEDIIDAVLTIIDCQPTEEEVLQIQRRRAATKRLKALLLLRYEKEIEKMTKSKEWVRVGSIGVIAPSLFRYKEERKTVTLHPGGAKEVGVQVKPMDSYARERLGLPMEVGAVL